MARKAKCAALTEAEVDLGYLGRNIINRYVPSDTGLVADDVIHVGIRTTTVGHVAKLKGWSVEMTALTLKSAVQAHVAYCRSVVSAASA
jgi:hypothetical protein